MKATRNLKDLDGIATELFISYIDDRNELITKRNGKYLRIPQISTWEKSAADLGGEEGDKDAWKTDNNSRSDKKERQSVGSPPEAQVFLKLYMERMFLL